MEIDDKLNLILSKLEGLEKGQSSIQQELAEIKQAVLFLASKKCTKWQLKMYHSPIPKLFSM